MARVTSLLLISVSLAALATCAANMEYLAELTDDDMRLALRDRGVNAPVDASRRTLVRLMRESDERTELEGKVAAAGANKASSGPTKVSVRYCVGWGYRNAYDQLASALRRTYGGRVIVEGDNYPPTALNALLSNVLMTAALIGFLAVTFVPQVTEQIRDNRGMVYLGLFIVYQVAGGLLQTGAFEVEVNGNLIFSKLQTGQSPPLDQLFQTIGRVVLGA